MKRKVPETQNVSTGSRDVLTEILREGARDMLAEAIENEVAEYIARHAHLRDDQGNRLVGGFVRERHGSPKFHCERLNDPPWPSTLARRGHTRQWRVPRYWLLDGETLGPVRFDKFRGSLPSLALWLAIRLSLNFVHIVSSAHIKFRSGPVASLWPGWIVQLIHSSFAWHTPQNVTAQTIFCEISA